MSASRVATYGMQRAEREVVHLDPDRTAPVVLALPEERVRLAERPQSERGPEMLGVAEELQGRAEMGRVGREERKHKGEEGDVAAVADVVRFVCGSAASVTPCDYPGGRETHRPRRRSRRSTSVPPRSSADPQYWPGSPRTDPRTLHSPLLRRGILRRPASSGQRSPSRTRGRGATRRGEAGRREGSRQDPKSGLQAYEVSHQLTSPQTGSTSRFRLAPWSAVRPRQRYASVLDLARRPN